LARHAKAVPDQPTTRITRIWTVVLVWVCGLISAWFGIAAAAARYGCTANDDGVGCQTSGSVVGVLIVVAVVAVVTAVTVLTHERPPRRVIIIGAAGVAALVCCFVAARILLGTV
jgi:hypothetical protein